MHEEGQINRKEDGDYVYRYDLKDQLGNNRLTFTTETEVDYFWATMEDVDPKVQAFEEKVFQNINNTTRFISGYNTTLDSEVPGANKVARLYARSENEQVIFGPTKSLRVQKGDKVSLQVRASYENPPEEISGLSANLTAMALSAFQVDVMLEATRASALEAFFDPKALLSDDGSEVPNAYLNYILFDEDYKLKGSGAVRLSDAAANNVEGELLTFAEPVEINHNGYMYIYVSNESDWYVNVFFDDLKIEHELSKIIQQEDFYPGGLTFNQQPNRELSSKYLYQNKEWQDELGLRIFDFHWRGYDPALIRTWQQDQLAEKYYSLSPYSWVANNPISNIDPTGMAVEETSTGTTYTEEDARNKLRELQSQYNSHSSNKPRPLGIGSGSAFQERLAGRDPYSVDDNNNQQNKGIDLNTAKNFLDGVGHVSGGIGTMQVGMLEYRQSLSIHSKIGTFSRFSGAYRILGSTGRVLGGASTYVGAPLSVFLDYKAMQSGEISTSRFFYRMTGVGASIVGGAAIGSSFGGPWGAAGGALIGGAFWAGEKVYDVGMWLLNETSRQIYNFENAIKNGWYPGR